MKAAFDKFMGRNPFIASLALFLICNISLYIIYVFWYSAVLGLSFGYSRKLSDGR